MPNARRRVRIHRPSLATLLIALLALAGLCASLYPTSASWVSQYRQSLNIIDYGRAVSTVGPVDLKRVFAEAKRYNRSLKGWALVAANHSVPNSDADSGADRVPGAESGSPVKPYDELLKLDAEGLMGRIQIPRIDVDLPIYHGTSEETLLRGVGHLKGTSLPVGGRGTRSVLTAHRGLASAKLFTDLDRVRRGDPFTLNIAGHVLSYRVVKTQVVKPDETETLLPVAGRDLVTLVTCTPLGVNTHRILVHGERVYPTPRGAKKAATSDPSVPHFPWWMLLFGAGLSAIASYALTDGFRRDPVIAEKQQTAEPELSSKS